MHRHMLSDGEAKWCGPVLKQESVFFTSVKKGDPASSLLLTVIFLKAVEAAQSQGPRF